MSWLDYTKVFPPTNQSYMERRGDYFVEFRHPLDFDDYMAAKSKSLHWGHFGRSSTLLQAFLKLQQAVKDCPKCQGFLGTPK